MSDGEWVLLATLAGPSSVAHRLATTTPNRHGAVRTLCDLGGRAIPIERGAAIVQCATCRAR